MFGLETVALTERQEAQLEVAELKMLRFSLGGSGRTEVAKSEGRITWSSLETKSEARLR